MARRRTETQLPGWLWFFLALPIGLITVLLLRRKQVPLLQRVSQPAQRYTEPDSIPIDTRRGPEESLGLVADEELPRTDQDQEIALTEPLPPAAAAAEAGETTGKPDDLKLIEGIGPSISGILRNRGITSFKTLAATPVEKLETILQEVNLRRLSDPATWPEQAALAARGDWEGLEAFQRTLKGGRRQG